MNSKRPQFFAMKLLRKLNEMRAVEDIGTAGIVLVMSVAVKEDLRRYSAPVPFYNEELMKLCDIRKWETFDRLRKTVIDSGWLEFTPAKRGSREAGNYRTRFPSWLTEENDDGVPHRDGIIKGQSSAKETESLAFPNNPLETEVVPGNGNGHREGEGCGYSPGDPRGPQDSERRGVALGAPTAGRCGELSFPVPGNSPPPPRPFTVPQDGGRGGWEEVVHEFQGRISEIEELALEAQSRGMSESQLAEDLRRYWKVANAPCNAKKLTNPVGAVVHRFRKRRWPVDGLVEEMDALRAAEWQQSEKNARKSREKVRKAIGIFIRERRQEGLDSDAIKAELVTRFPPDAIHEYGW